VVKFRFRNKATSPKNIAGREIHRLLQNLTQEDLAACLHVHGYDINLTTRAKIQAGIRCLSDIEVVILAKVLGCTPNDLLSRDTRYCLKLLGKTTIGQG
jgi:plasmid maintenance system antidote protein VapI